MVASSDKIAAVLMVASTAEKMAVKMAVSKAEWWVI
jgi:hypothetical protein